MTLFLPGSLVIFDNVYSRPPWPITPANPTGHFGSWYWRSRVWSGTLASIEDAWLKEISLTFAERDNCYTIRNDIATSLVCNLGPRCYGLVLASVPRNVQGYQISWTLVALQAVVGWIFDPDALKEA